VPQAALVDLCAPRRGRTVAVFLESELMARVFIIGWDGATFDLIKPWVAQGKLPTIARLMATGAHGLLRSTLPPMTFPAWTTFLTGKNQGKHGIFDFTRQPPNSYALEFVNGARRRALTFWQLLSQAGRQVISISVPCTFPPDPVNGIMISGFDAPGLGGRGAHVDARGMYPPELCQELAQKAAPHPIGAFMVAEINQGRPDLGLERQLQTVRGKANTAKYLLTTRPWDCAMIMFGESDGSCHHFWKYCDTKSPLFTDKPPGLSDSIFKVYEELDRTTEELLKLVPADTVVLLVSDHGFGGVSNWILYPNCWLREQGLLRFRGGFARWRSRVLDAVKLRAVAKLPAKLKRALYRWNPRRLGGIEGRVRYGFIDWAGTQAYFEENPYYPVLWINLKGRQPRGVVEPGRPYEELRDRLIAQLEAWRHPESGEPIVEKAYRREELYSGPCVEDFPDIIVKWGLHQGYLYAYRVSSKSPDLAWIKQVDPNAPANQAFFTGKSGSHRDDGIFVAHGPDIRQGTTIHGARLLDLAPTILALQDVPVPADMDGRVLEDIFVQPPKRSAASAGPADEVAVAARENGAYSAQDEEKIAERLRALGYME
jgi:predicted AlkP superfamily phosphohydrolase/phosphomutase